MWNNLFNYSSLSCLELTKLDFKFDFLENESFHEKISFSLFDSIFHILLATRSVYLFYICINIMICRTFQKFQKFQKHILQRLYLHLIFTYFYLCIVYEAVLNTLRKKIAVEIKIFTSQNLYILHSYASKNSFDRVFHLCSTPYLISPRQKHMKVLKSIPSTIC